MCPRLSTDAAGVPTFREVPTRAWRARARLGGLVILALLTSELRPAPIHKKPAEVGIDTAVLVDSERLLSEYDEARRTGAAADAPNCDTILEDMKREVAKYTTQFVEERRILDERRTGRVDPGALDKNSIRLLSLARAGEYGKIQYLGESPLMYRLHRVMGRCYEIQNKKYEAVSEYSMAFRYTSFEQPWQELPEQTYERLRPEQLAEREHIWQLMARGFADPDRLHPLEESDAALRDAGLRFRTLLESYGRLKIRAERARRDIDAAIARRGRGLPGVSVADATAEYNRLNTELINTYNQLETVRRGAYKTYHAGKEKRDGELAFKMALLVKDLETENKRLSRILNRSTYYRGVGNTEVLEKTRFIKFVGYSILLEMAHRIDPDNLQYISLLAEEYRIGQLPTRAIALEERYIELALKASTPPADLAEHYLRLGGLYTDRRQYIHATEAYSSYLKLETDAAKRRAIALFLADLNFSRTGDFGAAQNAYRAYIGETDAVDKASLGYKNRVEHHATRYRVFRNLASIDRRNHRTPLEKRDLERAVEEYRELEIEYQRFQEEENQVRRDINDVKRQLLRREDRALQVRYYQMVGRDLPAAQERTSYLRTHLNAMNLPGILERQAFLALRDRDFEAALDLYREIIRRGSGEQATRARRNIENVNQTLADGILRKPVLPADFER